MRIKKAFTLAEVLIVFVIIGIIATIGISSSRPWEKANKYAYARIYNALSTTMYNVMSKSSRVEPFPANSGQLCCALLEYMNTAGRNGNYSQVPCTLRADGTYTIPANHVCGLSDLDKSPAINRFTEDYNKDHPQKFIKLSNGAYIWIGSNNGAPWSITRAQNFLDGNNNPIEFRYYMVFADLNGFWRPNSPVWYDIDANGNITPKSRLADIVAFAITDKYTVLPLGYPLVDTRFLNAHVVYPADNDEGETISNAMTFHEARVRAFGFGKNNAVSNHIDLFSTDYERYIGLTAGSNFRVRNYNDFYSTEIPFDSNPITNVCYSQDTNGNQIKSTICDVKIYDYH